MDKHTFWIAVTDAICFVALAVVVGFMLVSFAIAILGGL